MAVKKHEANGRGMSAFTEKESLTAFIRKETEEHGFTLKASYALAIANSLIENEKTILGRIPSETLGGLLEVSGRNVEATLVARAYEGAMRPGGERLPEETVDGCPFPLWDRQEAALEAWARMRGIWHDDICAYAERNYDKKIGEGSEAQVFRYDGTHVAKVLSVPFNPQETLDRIAVTNFLFPATRLDIEGLGRGADGQLCFLLRQPFIKGRKITEGYSAVEGLEQFTCLDPDSPNPDYITSKYILGDLHDRNVLVDENGQVQVIDCNVFLNTPSMGKAGEWVIPPMEWDGQAVMQIDAQLETLIPKTVDRRTSALEVIVSSFADDFTNQLESAGRYDGPVTLPLKTGEKKTYVFQLDPADPGKLLYSEPEKIRRLLESCPQGTKFSREETGRLTMGHSLKKNGKTFFFSLKEGRIKERKIKERKIKEKRVLINSRK